MQKPWKSIAFLHCLSIISLPLLRATPIPLQEAIQKSLIQLEVEGAGGYTGKALTLKLSNPGNKALEILVPAGQIFTSADTSEQNLLVIREQLLLVERAKPRIVHLFTACIQADHASPSEGSAFLLSAMATGPLLQLAKYISEKGLQEEPAVQHAVWAVTDQHPLENIYQSDLAGFAAELLGKSAPEYAIVHQLPQEAGAPAFRPAPARLEGYFRYNLPEEQIVSFGLYDAEGKVVHHFFTNRKQLRGYHKFRFTFEIRNVPSGDYTVRLVSGNKTIEKMEVKF